MRIFISIPTNGRADEDVAVERRAIMERLANWASSTYGENKNEVLFLDSSIDGFCCLSKDRHEVYFLGEYIKRLAAADLVVFANGCDGARWCKLEISVCEAYGIPHMTVDQLEAAECKG